jgi:hypothetical protein
MMRRNNFDYEEEDFKEILLETGKLFASLSWDATKYIVKNTPKAVADIAYAKRRVVEAVEEGIVEFQKFQKEQKLEEKILELKKRSGKES